MIPPTTEKQLHSGAATYHICNTGQLILCTEPAICEESMIGTYKQFNQ